MDDTEVVTLTKKPRGRPNTKPEVAREKLKEKRERLKKEKENLIIEEAKKRLIEDEQKKKIEEEQKKAEEEQKKSNDPMFMMMKRMEEMMAMLKPAEPKIEPMLEPITKPKRQTKSKTEPKTPAPTPKKVEKIIVPKPIKPRKKKVYYDAEDSPSNIFVGSKKANIPYEEPEEAYIEMPPQNQYVEQPNPLLAKMMLRRRMNGNY